MLTSVLGHAEICSLFLISCPSAWICKMAATAHGSPPISGAQLVVHGQCSVVPVIQPGIHGIFCGEKFSFSWGTLYLFHLHQVEIATNYYNCQMLLLRAVIRKRARAMQGRLLKTTHGLFCTVQIGAHPIQPLLIDSSSSWKWLRGT